MIQKELSRSVRGNSNCFELYLSKEQKLVVCCEDSNFPKISFHWKFLENVKKTCVENTKIIHILMKLSENLSHYSHVITQHRIVKFPWKTEKSPKTSSNFSSSFSSLVWVRECSCGERTANSDSQLECIQVTIIERHSKWLNNLIILITLLQTVKFVCCFVSRSSILDVKHFSLRSSLQ